MIYARDICSKIGKALFMSLFKNMQMVEKENTLSLVFKDSLSRDSVQTKFESDISITLGTEKKVKFVLDAEA